MPVIIDRAINTDEPGATSGLVQKDIYDSIKNRYLLIPRGSRVMLSYNAQIRPKQKRLQLRADRILFPTNSSIQLDGNYIGDEHGAIGIAEPEIHIDNHYDELFKTYASGSVVNTLLDKLGGVANFLGESGGPSAKDIILSQTVMNDLALKPTITVRPGTIIYIILTKDLILEPYQKT